MLGPDCVLLEPPVSAEKDRVLGGWGVVHCLAAPLQCASVLSMSQHVWLIMQGTAECNACNTVDWE